MAAAGGEGGEKDENAKLALAFMSNICCVTRATRSRAKERGTYDSFSKSPSANVGGGAGASI